MGDWECTVESVAVSRRRNRRSRVHQGLALCCGGLNGYECRQAFLPSGQLNVEQCFNLSAIEH